MPSDVDRGLFLSVIFALYLLLLLLIRLGRIKSSAVKFDKSNSFVRPCFPLLIMILLRLL